MMKTWRTLAAVATLSTVVLVTAGTAHAQNCVPGIQEAFQKHQEVYMTLVDALNPEKANLEARLKAMVDQATYELLLTDARTLASSIANGRVLITVPDGTVVLDTARPDDPNNQLPAGNSFKHFKDKTVNENHNSRVAVFDAQQYPCAWGLETKFSTSDDQREVYAATRLGDHLDSEGTARISTKQ